jgi:hypothetical protein
MKLSVDVDLKLTPETLAAAFCDMDDEQQAQFFIEAARIAETWTSSSRHMQWFYVGRHLKTCTCSTEDARAMVRDIASACMETETP